MAKEIKAQVVIKFTPNKKEAKIENVKKLLIEANMARVAIKE